MSFAYVKEYESFGADINLTTEPPAAVPEGAYEMTRAIALEIEQSIKDRDQELARAIARELKKIEGEKNESE